MNIIIINYIHSHGNILYIIAKFTVKPETLEAIRARDPDEIFVDKFRFCAACHNSTIDKLLQ